MGLPFLDKPKPAPPTNNISVQSQSDEAPKPYSQISATRFWLLSLGICLGLFLSIIDSSIVATALYTIGKDFEDLSAINWVALAYTLSYLGFAVAFAHVSDVIGRRNAFFTAYMLFLASSLASGAAKTLPQLIAFRAIQGIGGSGLYCLTMIILPEICPPNYFKFIGSLIGMVIASSGILGPVLGAVLTEYTQWRWIFWINGPLGGISMAIFLLCWPSKEHYNPARRLQWKNFDFFGTFLIIAAAVLIVFAFQNSGRSFDHAFDRAVFIAPATLGLLCWFGAYAWAFLVEHGQIGKHLAPALPVKLSQNRFYASAAVTTLLTGYPYLQILFIFPTRAQVVSGKSVLVSGLELLPMIGATALGSVTSGFLSRKRNFLFETIFTGCCFTMIGCGLLYTVQDGKDDAKALGFLVFAGLGFGLCTSSATITVTQEALPSETALAHGFVAQMRILGGSIGIASASILLRQQITKQLGGQISAEDIEIFAKGLGGFDQAKRLAIVSAYGAAFRAGMKTSTMMAGLALLASCLGFRKSRMNMERQRAQLKHEEERRRANGNVTIDERTNTA